MDGGTTKYNLFARSDFSAFWALFTDNLINLIVLAGVCQFVFDMPAEIVFDQGLGDLFVIRVAGNVVAPSQIGSVEFAAAQFGVQLVVVLGHSRCGAVMATIDELQQPSENRSPNLRSIVDRVRPSVAGLMETDLRHDHEALLRESVRANIRMSVAQLQNGSVILESLIADRGLRIVGAEYSLESGEVRFLDDLDGV